MNMSLRLHVAVVMLLFPLILLAQTLAAAPQASSAAPSAGTPYPTMSAAAQGRARQLSQAFGAGNTAALWAAFSPQMKKQYGTAAKLAAGAKGVDAKLGPEKKVVAESVGPNLLKPGTDYARLSEFTNSPTRVLTILDLNDQGEVTGFLFRPVPDIPEGQYAGYKDVTKLKLPFSGPWFVYAGGRSLVQSAHFGSDEERYAMDFFPVKDGRPFSGDGSTNEQFYCFGQPVLAPGDGTVVRLRDGFADNEPGKPARGDGSGNQVVLNHGNKEYSLLAHLKQNSIKVKKGDKVKQGDTIAACGNSGNSPSAHLEMRLQNSHGYPLPATLPIQFVDYMVDGKVVESGEPVRGQVVSNVGTTASADAPKK
jgi:murein DD-endopeptidase MepM/ murein hydrolase activator NlpD